LSKIAYGRKGLGKHQKHDHEKNVTTTKETAEASHLF
jgi:hypothetical protein